MPAMEPSHLAILAARRYTLPVYVVAVYLVRPCVRYKPVYTVKKRINISCKQRRTVAQEVYSFLLPNILVKFR